MGEGFDRRERDRTYLPEYVRLELVLGGQLDSDGSPRTAAGARILDSSESGLRAEGTPEWGEGLEVGQKLPPCRLRGKNFDVPLAGLLLRRLEMTRGRVTLAVEVQDPGTSARLWEVCYRVRAGRWPDAAIVAEPPQRPPKLPARGHYTEAARLERLRWLRAATDAPLVELEHTTLDPQRLTGNIENLVGGVEVPVGVAGPLWFRGHHARGFVYAPFATTEGALVASATRGATAISRSGGVTAMLLGQRMVRAPLFVLSDIQSASKFTHWVLEHLREIREQTQLMSSHAELVEVEPHQIGNTVHLRFLYETGDAAGQNMTTACTWKACRWILEQMQHFDDMGFENLIVEANMSGDKKATFLSFIAGRGIRVAAECTIERQVLREVLKVTPEQMERCNQWFMAGSLQVGMIGYNINVANAVAAIFTATGQDIACVHESSLGIFSLRATEEGLYASIVLPGLIVGTVGGGTHLGRQSELLELMGCAGPGKAARFAEIIAGFSLALDLSTLAAIASGQFATAHEKLGRNRPVEHFTRSDLVPSFFESSLQTAMKDPLLQVIEADPVDPDAFAIDSSIITELTSRRVKKQLVGLLPYRVHHRDGLGVAGFTDLIVKSKPTDEEVILMVNGMASMCGEPLASVYSAFRHRTGFAQCHVRELAIYEEPDPRLVRHVPRVYRTLRDDEREAYVIVLERLVGVELLNSANDPSGWHRDHIEAALAGIAEIHSIWLGREQELLHQPWIGFAPSRQAMVEMSTLWEALAEHAAEEFPDWMGPRDLEAQLTLVQSLPEWWAELESMPRTLVHNDFNPRNLALRTLDDGGHRLCAYDWELATLHVPQHDLAELLCFVLAPSTELEVVDHYVEHHRICLEKASGRMLDPVTWRRGYELSLRDLVVNRIALYTMAHTFRDYHFLDRILKTSRRLIELESARRSRRV